MHPALYSWRDEVPAALVRLLAYLGGIAVLSMAAALIFQPPQAPLIDPINPVHRSEWIAADRPIPAFALAISEAGDDPSSYAIWRHAEGGGRKDILTLGDPNAEGPNFVVEIYRPGGEAHDFTNPVLTVTTAAEALGPVALQADSDPLPSKFGPLSIVMFDTSKGVPHHCLGFVRSLDDPQMQISGRFCQSGAGYVAVSTLECALDRLTLLSAGGDPKIGALFAQAELNRRFCGQRSPLLTPTPKFPGLWGKRAAR